MRFGVAEYAVGEGYGDVRLVCFLNIITIIMEPDGLRSFVHKQSLTNLTCENALKVVKKERMECLVQLVEVMKYGYKIIVNAMTTEILSTA